MSEEAEHPELAELRAELDRQATEIAELRAVIGHLITGITAVGKLSFDLPRLTSNTLIAKTFKVPGRGGTIPDEIVSETLELEYKIGQSSEALDEALKHASRYVWDEDGKIRR